MNLPELPEPSYAVNNVEKRYYTAEALRSYAAEAVRLEREAAAKACEQLAKANISVRNREAAMTANDCATAIRARSTLSKDVG